MQYFVSFLVLQPSWLWGRENWLLYFNCLHGVVWLFLFCGFSSWCHPWVGLQWVFVVFSDHFCLLFCVHEVLVYLASIQRFAIDLFDLILYVPVNNFSVLSGRVFLGWTRTKQGFMCLTQGHNIVTPVRLEPAPFCLKSSTLPLSHCAPREWHTISVSKAYGVTSVEIVKICIQVNT